VPLTIGLLSAPVYGIWITIFSIVSWFNIMDIGLGNGFRNKFAEAIAEGNINKAKEYTATLYSSMILIVLSFIILYSFIHSFLNWEDILNIQHSIKSNLNTIVYFVFVLLGLQLILKNINMVLLALQKTALSNLLPFLGNIIALIGILILSKLGKANLFSIAMVFMMAPIFVFAISTIILYNSSFKLYRPNSIRFNINSFKEIMNLGVKFFIIQISMIVIYSSSNILITQLYGPEEVTPYNIAYRLFTAFQIFFTIIVTPFWSAFTEANMKSDTIWIRKAINKLIKIWVLFSIFLFGVWTLTPFLVKFWIGNSVYISYELSFQFMIFSILFTYSSIMSSYLAGIGKIQLSLYIAIIQSIINIPLAILLADYCELKTIGIILALNINMLIPVILSTYQAFKILNKQPHGIWNK
jgi:O-antigen/teichoic acid export membrane protein